MKDISFCPFCSAPSHKMIHHSSEQLFCKECDSFFSLKPLPLTCPKCEKVDKIEASDFPGAEGEIILQCKSCKKMFNCVDLLKENGY